MILKKEYGKERRVEVCSHADQPSLRCRELTETIGHKQLPQHTTANYPCDIEELYGVWKEQGSAVELKNEKRDRNPEQVKVEEDRGGCLRSS